MKIVTRAPVAKDRGSRGLKVSKVSRPVRSPYFYLSCEHLTNVETQLAYSCWRPSQHEYFCETCGRWRVQKPKPKPPPIPEEPMF